MEKWTEVYKGIIPCGKYLAELKNGESDGLVILLETAENSVKIDFGGVSAIRMLDEGILLQGLFEESEVTKFKKENFSNIIYELLNGEFENSIRKISGEIYDILKFKHYLIITLNYVIEIISQWEPSISITPLDIK